MNLTFNDIKNIHKKIRHNVKWTETTFTSSISEKLGIDTFLKLENRQHTGAFKIRGSYSKLLSLSEVEKKAGVVAMSAGNHAQGLAYISNKMNIKSNIVMPEGTPFTKIRRTQNFGGNVIINGQDLNESYQHVCDIPSKIHLMSLENDDRSLLLEADGADSSSNYLLLESYNLQTQSPYADNNDLDTQGGFDTSSTADDILDFTERNPFGEVDF